MMRETNVIENLQKDIVIPEDVQAKADRAFEQIKAESDQKRKGRTGKMTWRTMKIAVAAAALTIGTVSVCAATYLHWSSGLEEEFHATAQQKQYLEERQIAAPVNESVTEGNITITAQQSIVDSKFAYLSFKVEGYDLEEGKEPAFESIGITVDGKEDFSWSGRFFNGWMKDENGGLAYANGWAPDRNENGVMQENFVAEDGSLEFELRLQTDGTDGFFTGAKVHLEFKNLGTVSKAEYFPDLEETWVLDVVLQGSDEVRSLTLSEKLGNSGATVTGAEISPISLQVTYDFPAQQVEMEGVDENGEPVKTYSHVEPPLLTGVRLKDGTMLTGLFDGGQEGYEDVEKGVYKVMFATNRILDTEQVDALLFIKNAQEGDQKLTEDNLYIVPVK